MLATTSGDMKEMALCIFTKCMCLPKKVALKKILQKKIKLRKLLFFHKQGIQLSCYNVIDKFVDVFC